jgi:hypothetical protein
MIFKPDLEVDFEQVPGYRSGGLATVIRATNFFILQICKNNIILVKNFPKKKLVGFKMGFKKNLTKKLDPHCFIMVFRFDLGVDPKQLQGHKLSKLTRITRID